ncbi:MAG: tetratricopeptide repeat protein [Deltaproteobacteria bacterium]|nr:tetratricopeptide repeat protein [Deltaproteobacteria bacterium]
MIPRQEIRQKAERLVAEGKLAQAAQAFLEIGLAERALGLVERLLDDEPLRPDLLLLLGRIHTERGEHEQAAAALRKVCQCDERSAGAHLELAQALTRLGDLDTAFYHLGESLHLDPTRVDAYATVAQLLWELGKPRACLEFLTRSVKSLPIPELYSLLARAATVAQKRDAAHTAIGWLREHTPESVHRSLELGSLHLALGELEQAAQEYRQAELLDPASPKPAHALATLFVEQSEREPAEAAFRRALARDASYWPSLNDLGLLLLADGRAAEAIPLLRRAVTLQPQEPASHLNLALALLAAGARAAAQHHARAALSLATDADLATQAADLVRQLS